jgi:hypothetical protein
VEHHDVRRGPREPHRADAADPVPAFAGPAVLRRHLLVRDSR